VIGEAGGNIVEVAHQRLFTDAPIRSTSVELSIETMDRPHADTVIAAVAAAGYDIDPVPLDV
jgi:threonine dehydratase